MHRNCVATASALLVFCIVAGCGSNSHLPATLKPQSFQPAANATPTQPTQANGGAANSAKTQNVNTADDAQLSANIPTTRPATRPAVGASSGTFMYIGTVVAEVNGQPIYADKILAKVDTELSAKAPLLEPREFRLAAESAIRRQIKYDIPLELKFAAAQRSCTDEDRQRAFLLAVNWRTREIIKAGGSLAV